MQDITVDNIATNALDEDKKYLGRADVFSSVKLWEPSVKELVSILHESMENDDAW